MVQCGVPAPPPPLEHHSPAPECPTVPWLCRPYVSLPTTLFLPHTEVRCRASRGGEKGVVPCGVPAPPPPRHHGEPAPDYPTAPVAVPPSCLLAPRSAPPAPSRSPRLRGQVATFLSGCPPWLAARCLAPCSRGREGHPTSGPAPTCVRSPTASLETPGGHAQGVCSSAAPSAVVTPVELHTARPPRRCVRRHEAVYEARRL